MTIADRPDDPATPNDPAAASTESGAAPDDSRNRPPSAPEPGTGTPAPATTGAQSTPEQDTATPAPAAAPEPANPAATTSESAPGTPAEPPAPADPDSAQSATERSTAQPAAEAADPKTAGEESATAAAETAGPPEQAEPSDTGAAGAEVTAPAAEIDADATAASAGDAAVADEAGSTAGPEAAVTADASTDSAEGAAPNEDSGTESSSGDAAVAGAPETAAIGAAEVAAGAAAAGDPLASAAGTAAVAADDSVAPGDDASTAAVAGDSAAPGAAGGTEAAAAGGAGADHPAASGGPAGADAPTVVIPAAAAAAAGPAGGPDRVAALWDTARSRRGVWLLAGAAAVVVIVVVALVLGLSGGSTTPAGPSQQAAAASSSRAAIPPATLSVPAAQPEPVAPLPITVQAGGGTLAAVTVHGPHGDVAGALAADRTSWTTTDPLDYSSGYTVVADAVNAGGAHTQQNFTVTTLTPHRTAYANVVPAPEVVSDTGIGVGQPMVFQFTAPVADKAEVQKHLHVTMTPPQPGAWYWVDDRDAHFRGPNYWLPGTKIHIQADVLGVDLGNGIYGAENYGADYTVHDAWVAKADGNTEQLTIFQNGNQVNQMVMSLGDPGHPSHEGPHVISGKQPSIVMDSCTYGVCAGQSGYYSETVYLDLRISNDGEFVHSAPWSVGQQGSSNVSHGCVNLSPANAQWFYDHFGIGDVVEIVNSGGPTLPVWDTYGDWEIPWDVWQAGNAQD